MPLNHQDDEMFDDLHQGVEALRTIAKNKSIPLSEKASESLFRLQTNVPIARDKFRAFKERLKDQTLQAARKTDQVAHQNPWSFTLGALGLGLLAGLLLSDGNEEED